MTKKMITFNRFQKRVLITMYEQGHEGRKPIGFVGAPASINYLLEHGFVKPASAQGYLLTATGKQRAKRLASA